MGRRPDRFAKPVRSPTAGSDSFQLAYRVNLDQGWLAYSEPVLTGWSDWVTGTPGQAYDFSALVAGQTESYGGRIRVHYDNGEHKNMWHTDNGSYNSPGGTVQENDFTLPTNANQFRFSYRVRLDKGWLAFNDLKLTGWSDTIPVTGGEQYELSLHLAGQLQAPVGQGGRIRVHYPGSSADPVALWVNPANFNNNGTIFSQDFTPPTNANSIQFSYEVTMDKGRLAFSEAALSHLNPAYTIIRKTYALGGQTIATRISGDQEGDNGLFYIHSDHLGSTSVMSYGQGHGSNSGNKVLDSTARYLPFGDWRVEPAHDLTDQGFTGQKHNMDLGLYYYNARFYLPYINRFISADPIVPDPANPQSFNRYSYVLNNPLRFIDPTGHFSEEAIYNYLLNNHCGASPICADDIMTEWSQNSEWWSMLLAAEAGDILFGAYGVLSGVKDGGFAFRFTGNGATELTGIIASDMFGNGANLLLPDSDRVNLQNIFQGQYTVDNPYLLTGEQIIRLNWGGFVRQLENGDHHIFARQVNWNNTFMYTEGMEFRDTLVIGTTTSVIGTVIVSTAWPTAPLIVSAISGGAIGTTVGYAGGTLWQTNGRAAGDLYIDVGTNRFVVRPGWHNQIIDFK